MARVDGGGDSDSRAVRPKCASVAGLGLRLASSVPLAIIFTFAYNRSGGNLLLMVLLHASINNTLGFWLPVHAGLYAAVALVTLGMVFLDRMWGTHCNPELRTTEDRHAGNDEPLCGACHSQRTPGCAKLPKSAGGRPPGSRCRNVALGKC